MRESAQSVVEITVTVEIERSSVLVIVTGCIAAVAVIVTVLVTKSLWLA